MLSIAKDDKIFLGGTQVTWKDLEAKLKSNERVKKESALYIEADTHSCTASSITAMAVAKNAGVTQVMMLTASVDVPQSRRNSTRTSPGSRRLSEDMSLKDGEMQAISVLGAAS